ncbi:hypothetical protein [Actinomyces israelii]|uniref:hypothetical protein n=1 Tax=Actinomyces israelii TaxID=1659 RepID=UPI0023521C3B|nr:hypothetical protein [Actinomyces israelii]
MESPGPARQRHDWGSSTATPELLRSQPDDDPWAEARYSTHPAGRTRLADGASPAALIDSGPPPSASWARTSCGASAPGS